MVLGVIVLDLYVLYFSVNGIFTPFTEDYNMVLGRNQEKSVIFFGERHFLPIHRKI